MKKLFGIYSFILAGVLLLAGYGFVAGDASSALVAGGVWLVCTLVWLIVLGVELVSSK